MLKLLAPRWTAFREHFQKLNAKFFHSSLFPHKYPTCTNDEPHQNPQYTGVLKKEAGK